MNRQNFSFEGCAFCLDCCKARFSPRDRREGHDHLRYKLGGHEVENAEILIIVGEEKVFPKKAVSVCDVSKTINNTDGHIDGFQPECICERSKGVRRSSQCSVRWLIEEIGRKQNKVG